MTIKNEKKAYEAPKMTVVEVSYGTSLLCNSEPCFDSFDLEEGGEVGAIDIFGNDKA